MELYEQVIVALPTVAVEGQYDEQEQMWTIECEAQLSPQKHHQEH